MRRSLALLAAPLALFLAPAPARAADRDCSDFPNQAAAQAALQPGDPDGLDGDGDGVACESLPCPCDGAGPGVGGGNNGGGGPKTKKDRARVVKVIDGDTVRVRIKRRIRDVRLIGIDTPEVYGGEECGGAAASKLMRRMLPRGSRVRLIGDPTQDDRDRYGRLLRYVEIGSRDVGQRELSRGLAAVYVFDSTPFRRVGPYRRASRRAEARNRGAWGACGGDFHLLL